MAGYNHVRNLPNRFENEFILPNLLALVKEKIGDAVALFNTKFHVSLLKKY